MKRIYKVLFLILTMTLFIGSIYADVTAPDINVADAAMTCEQLLGPNLVTILHLGIRLVQIAGVVIALVQCTLALLPAVSSKDADALNKAIHKCIMIGFILVLLGIFPSLLHIIGSIGGFDLSCL